MLHNKISNRLNYALRFSGSPIESPETVAQHVAAMQFMALELYNEFLSRNSTFDVKDVMYRITLHDLDEAAMGDIPRPVKYYDSEMLHQFERVSNAELMKNYGSTIANDAINAKSKSVLEGIIVDLLDSAQCVARLRISASYSPKYSPMLEDAVKIMHNKISSIDLDDPRIPLLKELMTAELNDTSL